LAQWVSLNFSEFIVRRNIPLLAEEGWMRGQLRNREATLFRADGVVSSAECKVFAGLTTVKASRYRARASRPSAPLQGGFAISC
jgi:hypothetical protein